MYTLKHLSDIGIISKRLKRVLVILGCTTFEDMIELSKDKIKVDYLEKSHKLKNELFKAISDVHVLDSILPEYVESVKDKKESVKVKTDSVKSTTELTKGTTESPQSLPSKKDQRQLRVGDYTEQLLKQSDVPIKIDDLLLKIKEFLPYTYAESVRANLNGDSQKRFVFFLDGYVGLKEKVYDKRFLVFNLTNKKIQYAEQRIFEFLSFMVEKHRSPQPHGLESEESLYRWFLDFTKSTAKEMADLRSIFKQYLKEYDQWMYTPYEYSYKRNCDQIKWYVDENLELPNQEEEPELAAWFNSQLECYEKYRDKRKKMFIDLMAYLEDYGMHFYDAKSAKGKAAKRKNGSSLKKAEESPVKKYSRLFESIKKRKDDKTFVVQKALLVIAIGNLIQKGIIRSNEITLSDELLMEFADACLDFIGTASSYNIAIPFYYLGDESFWSLIPQELMVCEDWGEEDPTYDYIESKYSCAIIDQDLFELLSDEKGFPIFKEALVESVIKGNGIPDDIAEIKVSGNDTPLNQKVLINGNSNETKESHTEFKLLHVEGKKEVEDSDIRSQTSRQNFSLEQVFQEYVLKIKGLRQAKKHGVTIVAKPVLLLTVIEGVEEGIINDNRIVLNEWLEQQYEKLMKHYTRNSIFKYIPTINNPFWNLKNDGFWYLHLGNNKEIYGTPTMKGLKDNVQYASFDDDLWILLQNYAMRHRLRDYIIEHKLSDDHDS